MRRKNKNFVDRSGKNRTIEFFAFLPITIDGESRWLERVKVLQCSASAINKLGDRSIEWFDERFIDEED